MPVRTVIVGRNALYALVDADDVHHREAVGYLKQLGRDVTLLIADTTLMEAMTLVRSRLGHDIALRTLLAIRRSTRYALTRLTDDEQLELWRIFEQCSDKDWSPFDCACLAVCRTRDIRQAFAFDLHFDQMADAGLRRVP